MAEPVPSSSLMRYSHHIGEDEVLRAPDLAKKGEQHLYNIVDGGIHDITFSIPFGNGQAVSVQFHAILFFCKYTQRTLYVIACAYTPSHDALRVEQVVEAVQKVYDVYIQVGWLNLGSDLLQCRRPPRRWEFYEPDKGADVKMHTLARMLSKKVKAGQKKREDLRGNSKGSEVDLNRSAHTIYQCLLQTTENGFDDYLDRVENALAAEVQEPRMKRRAWTAWFVLSCLQLVRDNRRTGRKHLAARGAKLANLIVNRLLISDGAAAMGVYDALAEQCYKLRYAAECSAGDIDRLGGLVANELHGKVHIPLDHSWIPLPGVLLSGLFSKVPYHTICEEIGLPNLSLLRFSQERSLLSERTVVVGAEMSVIREGWEFVSQGFLSQGIGERSKQDGGDIGAGSLHPRGRTPLFENCIEGAASGQGDVSGHVGGNATVDITDLDDAVESGLQYS